MAIAIDPNTTYQVIDGFGVNTGYGGQTANGGQYDMPLMTSAEADWFFGTLGFSIARSGACGIAGEARDTQGAALAKARRAKLSVLPMQPGGKWGPDAWYSPVYDQSSTLLGYSLDPAHYQDAANLAVTFLSNLAAAGISPDLIETTNEPDWQMWLTAAEHVAFAKVLGATLAANGFGSVKLKGPEVMNGPATFATFADPIIADVTARGYFSVLAWHMYGGALPAPYAAGPANGLSVWMSEYTGVGGTTFDPSIANGVAVAQGVHTALVQAQASAYCWHLYRPDGLLGAGEVPGGGNVGLWGLNGEHTKREYALAQFAKFVRPGMQRVACTGAPAGVYVSAYTGTNGKITVVVVNTNTTGGADGTGAVALTITGLGATPSMTPWITSSTWNLAQGADVPVNGGVLTYTMSGQSVLTLNYAPPDAPVIASPASGAGYSANTGSFPLQVTGCQPGATVDAWINGSPYTSTAADINGNAVAIVDWPLAADQAQAGDRAADAVRSTEAAQDGGAAGTAAGATATGAETPLQGASAVDAPGTGTSYGETPKQGGAATDVATGPQLSVEVLRQQAAQGDVAGDVFTPGGALAAPSIAAPATGTDLTGLPGAMVQAVGANAGAVIEFFINGQAAGSVGADVAGTAQWYLAVPWGSDSAQAGDRATDVYTPAPTGTIVEALKDGAGAGDLSGDRISARETAGDGGTVGDRAPQTFGEVVTDGGQAGLKGTSSVISPLSLPLPKPIHSRPIGAFLDADYMRACLFARVLSPYLRCGMSDIIYQGADRDIQFKLPQADADGNTIDYTSAQLRCGAQSGTGSRIPSDGTAINAVALTARARFIASTTASMIAGALYYYDGFVNLADGRILPVGNGSFTVRAPFTATP